MRRRLRLQTTSDDEEEEDERDQRQSQFVGNSNTNTNTLPPSTYPVDIISSDEDFVEAHETLSPPVHSPDALIGEDWDGIPIDAFLRDLGLGAKREWLDSCLRSLGRDVPGFERMDVAEKSRLCFEKFLVEDMNLCGRGVLPENVQGLHKVELEGPFVLQVDEAVNISDPIRDRYNAVPAGFKRCLKLSLTDGAQRIFGMEYRPIRELEVLAPAGSKVAICNVHIRRGLLMLVPEVFKVLGGLVENLELARQRLVQEIKKPPRGRRNQTVLPLSERASRAAWPSNTINNNEQMKNSTPEGTDHPQITCQVTASVPGGGAGRISVGELSNVHISGPVEAEVPLVHINDSVEYATDSTNRGTNSMNFPLQLAQASLENTERRISSNDFFSPPTERNSNVEMLDPIEEPQVPPGRMSNIQEMDLADHRPDAESSYLSDVLYEKEDSMNRKSAPVSSADPIEEPIVPSGRMNTPEASDLANDRFNALPSLHSASEYNDMDNSCEEECPIVLKGEDEIPFTYFSLLLTKYAAEGNNKPVQGNVKCFLTGVKRFQFKERSTFELCVYVDDGSQIYEVLVDHHFVQATIGCTPMEVTAALSTSDKKTVLNMKGTMMKFQRFLSEFEGTMVVEINEKQPLPVARELRQGCSTSDAWCLLRRLNTFTAPQSTQSHFPSLIELSP